MYKLLKCIKLTNSLHIIVGVLLECVLGQLRIAKLVATNYLSICNICFGHFFYVSTTFLSKGIIIDFFLVKQNTPHKSLKGPECISTTRQQTPVNTNSKLDSQIGNPFPDPTYYKSLHYHISYFVKDIYLHTPHTTQVNILKQTLATFKVHQISLHASSFLHICGMGQVPYHPTINLRLLHLPR